MRNSYDVFTPAPYAVYPVQPIQLTRHLGFCLGNAVKCVLRAPYKDGVEDCDKALRYLQWFEDDAPLKLSIDTYRVFEMNYTSLAKYLVESPGDGLWDDISSATCAFLENLNEYLLSPSWYFLENMRTEIRDLSRILSLRDTTGQIYEGMSGLPQKEADNGTLSASVHEFEARNFILSKQIDSLVLENRLLVEDVTRLEGIVQNQLEKIDHLEKEANWLADHLDRDVGAGPCPDERPSEEMCSWRHCVRCWREAARQALGHPAGERHDSASYR